MKKIIYSRNKVDSCTHLIRMCSVTISDVRGVDRVCPAMFSWLTAAEQIQRRFLVQIQVCLGCLPACRSRSPTIHFLSHWVVTVQARSYHPHRLPDLLSSGVSPQFVQQLLPQNLHFYYNIKDHCRCMKTLCNFWRGAFPIWCHFHHRPYSASPSLECLNPQREEQFWMILVFTLRQLSAINCAAFKRSILALTFLAVEDDTRFSRISSRI